jgi:hypothetical protein
MGQYRESFAGIDYLCSRRNVRDDRHVIAQRPPFTVRPHSDGSYRGRADRPALKAGQKSMTTELEALLERMKPVARDQTVRVLRHSNTCIPTCRVLQAVLGHFKFQSFPVATEVTACNPRYAEMIMSLGGRDTAVEPTPNQLKAWQDKGA